MVIVQKSARVVDHREDMIEAVQEIAVETEVEAMIIAGLGRDQGIMTEGNPEMSLMNMSVDVIVVTEVDQGIVIVTEEEVSVQIIEEEIAIAQDLVLVQEITEDVVTQGIDNFKINCKA